MEKEINTEWVNTVLNSESKKEYSGDLLAIDWLRGGKDYKRQLAFKVLPANSKENKIFSWIVGTHWLNHNNVTTRFVCPEQTAHLKKNNVKCPICEAKRRLLKAGFTDEELSVQGKFGLMPIFDPRIQSNIKVVVIASDTRQDWDKSHISILQQNGSFLTKWMVEKYIDKEIPDFTAWTGNLIKFTRPQDNSKWERDVAFTQFVSNEDVLAKLKEENEALVMPDLWKMPDDQAFIEVTQIVAEMEKDFMKAKSITESTVAVPNVEAVKKINTYESNHDEVSFAPSYDETSDSDIDDDTIPF